MNEVEQRSKDVDNKRAALVFEHEKERAKWDLEKNYIVQQKSELSEVNERMEKRKEGMLRENEKLRAEARGRKFPGVALGAGASTTASIIQPQFTGVSHINNNLGGGGGMPSSQMNSNRFGQMNNISLLSSSSNGGGTALGAAMQSFKMAQRNDEL